MTLALPDQTLALKSQRYFELLYVLTMRNIKVRYRGSVLGVYWSLLNPLIMTGVYTAVFGSNFASYYNNSLLNYTLAAFTGLTVINFFNSTTAQSLPSVVANGAILNKIRLPLSIMPLSMVAANIFQFMVGAFPLLCVITLLITHNPLNVLLLMIPLISLAMVSIGMSLLVSALYVFFRDLPYFYELVSFALFLTSPIFYPAAIVPDTVRPFLALNPLSPIIETIRQLTLNSAPLDWTQMGRALLGGLLMLMLGSTCFRLWYDEFMDLL